MPVLILSAISLKNVPDDISVVNLVSTIVQCYNGKLFLKNVKASPRSQRGGILLRFDPKPLSRVLNDIAESLEIPDLQYFLHVVVFNIADE